MTERTFCIKDFKILNTLKEILIIEDFLRETLKNVKVVIFLCYIADFEK